MNLHPAILAQRKYDGFMRAFSNAFNAQDVQSACRYFARISGEEFTPLPNERLLEIWEGWKRFKGYKSNLTFFLAEKSMPWHLTISKIRTKEKYLKDRHDTRYKRFRERMVAAAHFRVATEAGFDPDTKEYREWNYRQIYSRI